MCNVYVYIYIYIYVYIYYICGTRERRTRKKHTFWPGPRLRCKHRSPGSGRPHCSWTGRSLRLNCQTLPCLPLQFRKQSFVHYQGKYLSWYRTEQTLEWQQLFNKTIKRRLNCCNSAQGALSILTRTPAICLTMFLLLNSYHFNLLQLPKVHLFGWYIPFD